MWRSHQLSCNLVMRADVNQAEYSQWMRWCGDIPKSLLSRVDVGISGTEAKFIAFDPGYGFWFCPNKLSSDGDQELESMLRMGREGGRRVMRQM